MVRRLLPLFAVGMTIGGISTYAGYHAIYQPDAMRSAAGSIMESTSLKHKLMGESTRLAPPVRRTPLFTAGGGGGDVSVIEQIQDLAFPALPGGGDSGVSMEKTSGDSSAIRTGSGHQQASFFHRAMFQVYIFYRGFLLLVRSVPCSWYFLLSRLGLCDPHYFYVSLREMFIAMGPTYMKLGQWMATRPDVFSSDMCDVLSQLFDSTPPHPWSHTEKKLRASNVLAQLSSIEKVPLNSGSVAQVHRGVLRRTTDGVEAGTSVVVKVLHPLIEIRIAADLMAMRYAIKFLMCVVPGFEFTDPMVSVTEFSGLIISQLDLVRECDNLVQFRYNFRDMPRIVFPQPIPSITTKDVLVETFEAGQCIQKGNSLLVHDMELAELGCNMFHKMLFHDNFVHSDLHPGNVLVRDYVPAFDGADRKSSGLKQIVVLDTGLVTSLSNHERENFLALFGAIAAGDGAFGAKLMIERSKHSRCTDEPAFIAEMTQVFNMVNPDTTSGFTLASIEIGNVLRGVMQTLRKHQVYIDGNFASLVLTVIVGEGMGRKLHPEFNIFQASAPYLVQYLQGSELSDLAGKLRQRYGVTELMKVFGGVKLSAG